MNVCKRSVYIVKARNENINLTLCSFMLCFVLALEPKEMDGKNDLNKRRELDCHKEFIVVELSSLAFLRHFLHRNKSTQKKWKHGQVKASSTSLGDQSNREKDSSCNGNGTSDAVWQMRQILLFVFSTTGFAATALLDRGALGLGSCLLVVNVGFSREDGGILVHSPTREVNAGFTFNLPVG
jgi:hypothetical protein